MPERELPEYVIEFMRAKGWKLPPGHEPEGEECDPNEPGPEPAADPNEPGPA